ncbi:hypothetical protein OMR07_22695 [Methylobacterium organophilum]|nr:hypothetical protein [Methylobacterium organophilum]
MPIDSAASTGNLLLDALSGSDRALIAPHLEPVTFAKGDTALMAAVAASHVIFPHVQTVVALIVATRDGRTAEIASGEAAVKPNAASPRQRRLASAVRRRVISHPVVPTGPYRTGLGAD